MIAAAERAANERHFEHARFQVASVDRVPFEAECFDGVVSRFGIMFFPAPVEDVRELLRVVKPNRTMAFAVSVYLERNPFHDVLAHVVDRCRDSARSDSDSGSEARAERRAYHGPRGGPETCEDDQGPQLTNHPLAAAARAGSHDRIIRDVCAPAMAAPTTGGTLGGAARESRMHARVLNQRSPGS